MTGDLVRISVEDAGLRAALDRLEAAAADTAPMFDQIGAALVSSTIRRFELGVGPDGSPWQPSRRALEVSGQTLVDRGNSGLLGSITHVFDARSATVGTNLVYAAIHQRGGTIRAKTAKGLRFKTGGRWVTRREVQIPARPYLGIDPGDRTEILAIARDHVQAAIA